jgi:hypothetical protein
VYGPVRTVVWQGSAGDRRPYADLVAKGRVIRPLLLRFDADLVIHSESELLLAAEVMFRCLDGYVTEEELNLLKQRRNPAPKPLTLPRRASLIA